jgi:hypothetical protein
MYGLDRRTVRRWLMHAGIPLRTHEEVVKLLPRHPVVEPSILKDLYLNSNLSFSQIGQRFDASATWVRSQLISAGIPPRTPWREMYGKAPFSRDPREGAYLRGLRTGDLNCEIYGNQVRVATSTTHPEMYALLRNCFAKYGRLNKTPSRNKSDFEWLVYCYLNKTFSFLLEKCTTVPDSYMRDDELFLSFISGYIDAEGSFRLYQDEQSAAVSLRLRTEDRALLMGFRNKLRELGYHPYLALELERGYHKGKNYTKDVWMLGMFRKEEVLSLVKRLSMRHVEKSSWAALVLESVSRKWDFVEPRATSLRSSIKTGVRQFKEEAQRAYLKRHPPLYSGPTS